MPGFDQSQIRLRTSTFSPKRLVRCVITVRQLRITAMPSFKTQYVGVAAGFAA
jgi:hypothetical protein